MFAKLFFNLILDYCESQKGDIAGLNGFFGWANNVIWRFLRIREVLCFGELLLQTFGNTLIWLTRKLTSKRLLKDKFHLKLTKLK